MSFRSELTYHSPIRSLIRSLQVIVSSLVPSQAQTLTFKTPSFIDCLDILTLQRKYLELPAFDVKTQSSILPRPRRGSRPSSQICRIAARGPHIPLRCAPRLTESLRMWLCTSIFTSSFHKPGRSKGTVIQVIRIFVMVNVHPVIEVMNFPLMPVKNSSPISPLVRWRPQLYSGSGAGNGHELNASSKESDQTCRSRYGSSWGATFE